MRRMWVVTVAAIGAACSYVPAAEDPAPPSTPAPSATATSPAGQPLEPVEQTSVVPGTFTSAAHLEAALLDALGDSCERRLASEVAATLACQTAQGLSYIATVWAPDGHVDRGDAALELFGATSLPETDNGFQRMLIGRGWTVELFGAVSVEQGVSLSAGLPEFTTARTHDEARTQLRQYLGLD